MIIDSHTHHFPFFSLQEAESWAVDHAEPYWVRQMRSGRQCWVSLAQRIAHMDRAGVQRAILQGWYFEHPQSCQLMNTEYATCIRAYPRRLKAFAALQPAYPKEALETLAWAKDQGFCGIGELFPAVQGFELRGEAFRTIAQWAARQGWPILLHVTDPFGKPYPGMRVTPLADYLWMLRAFPDVVFILAHWGGLLPEYCRLDPERWIVREKGMIGEKGACSMQTALMPHVYYDTAASPLLYDADVWQRFVACVPASRILLGTDYPLNVAYDPTVEASFEPTLEALRVSGLPGEVQAAIAGGNAARLFGWSG